MSISGIGPTANAMDGASMKMLLRKNRNMAEENALDPERLAETAAPQNAAPATSGLMDRNFMEMGSEESRYVKANKAALQSNNEMVNRQNAILAASLSSSGEESYAMRNLAGKRAARRIMQEQQQAVREQSQTHLDKTQQAIEENAQQNGENAATENTAAATAPAPQTPQPAPTGEAAPESAPAQASVNVTV